MAAVLLRAVVRVLPTVVLLSALPGAAVAGGEAEAPFVVHEWGTFTSVQGADGVALEGLQHEEEALPDFVYSRSKVRECPLRKQGHKGLEVPANHVSVKMETPVLYFHTTTPRRVRVRVDFVGGLITQWYPVSDLLGPPEGACDDGPLDLAKVTRSFLQWDVDLLPGEAAPDQVPAVAADDPWAFARDVKAAHVRTLPRRAPERSGPVEAEKFLFYRGLGSFRLPFDVTVDGEGAVSFRNGSAHAVPFVIALEVKEGAALGRFSLRRRVEAGATEEDLFRGDAARFAEDAVGDVQALTIKVLKDQGMNEDEARAMVATWTRSWFRSEGLRVFYVVPRPLVDALLPLRIDPAPAGVERVLVGRIECIHPRTQSEVEAALRDLDGPRAESAKRRLERLGRFLEAHLRRVIATTTDAKVRAAAEALLPGAPGVGG